MTKKKYDITENATQILSTFKESCICVAKAKKIALKPFGVYFNEIIDAHLAKHDSIDAEVMMTEITQMGTVEKVVGDYEKKFPQQAKSSGIRKLHLSQKDRLLGGVCGGMAEYFQIDALLVRAAFVAGFFLAGITLFLYVILWLAMHERDKIKNYPPLVSIIFEVLHLVKVMILPIVSSILQRPLKTEENIDLKNTTDGKNIEKPILAAEKPKRKGIVRRFVGLVFFAVISILFYLPIIFGLLAVASFCIWGTFYPIVHVDGFNFSFAALSIPGVVTGISVAILAFFLFLLFAHVIFKMHLKSKILSKNSLILVCVLIVLTIFASGSGIFITVFQNKVSETIMVSKNFDIGENQVAISIEDLQNFNHAPIKVNHIAIYGEKERQNITVKAIITARGENEKQAKEHLADIEIEWSQNESLFMPKIIKNNDDFYFEDIKIELFVPATKDINIEGILNSELMIQGNFDQNITLNVHNTYIVLSENNIKKLFVQSENSYIQIKKSKIGELVGNLQKSKFTIEESHIENCKINNQDSRMHLHELVGHLNIENSHGNIHMEGGNGTLNVVNYKGRIKLVGFDFGLQSQNAVSNNDGFIEMQFLSKNLPKIETENNFGNIQNRMPHFATTEAIVKFTNKYGKITLDMKHIRPSR